MRFTPFLLVLVGLLDRFVVTHSSRAGEAHSFTIHATRAAHTAESGRYDTTSEECGVDFVWTGWLRRGSKPAESPSSTLRVNQRYRTIPEASRWGG
jgi:hypothetical protein